MSDAKIGFEMRKIRLSLAVILPVRQIKDPQKNIRRYKTIRASIKEVGMIEPLMYIRKRTEVDISASGRHLRYFALKELGETDADCIIANDDESFTYNAHISRLAPIQEHKMIVKAVRNGVRPERIAAALNISEKNVRASMKLLDGIHEEAADLLKDKSICPKAICLLKQVTCLRQIEIAEIMVGANNSQRVMQKLWFWARGKISWRNPKNQSSRRDYHPKRLAKWSRKWNPLNTASKPSRKLTGKIC